MAKRWQCTVCGYLHDGEEPPDVCPVCGADRSRFIPLEVQKAGLLQSMVAAFKLHPVAAHFPAGLLPTTAFLLLLYLVDGTAAFEAAAFWLLMIATAVVPVSLVSGLHDWRKYFGGQRASIFTRKITLALTLLVLGLSASAVRYGRPELFSLGGWPLWLYLACLAGMLACVVFLGHYGAVLVSRSVGQDVLAPSLSPGKTTGAWAEAVITRAPDAILVADPAGIIRLWNHGAERIFGVPASQAVGKSLDLIVPESLRQRHWEGWRRVMQTGESHYGEDDLLRVPALRGDGSRFSAEFSIVVLKDGAGMISGMAAILRDVSEQWEREKRLKEQLASCREQPSS
jgi:PAS domain S-box-containing protein